MTTRKRTTIKDVAALAGVSFATVSRALADRPEISDETKTRVRDACAQLGYVPNAAAKGLTGRATSTIGLVVPYISNPYFADMATAIEQTAAQHGYRVLLSNSLRDPELEYQAIDNFLARQVDGVLISPVSPLSQAQHRELMGDMPCVYLGVNHDEGSSYVMADNETGAYEATRYLLQLGHRDILFVGGRMASRTRQLRTRGFYRALEEAGLRGRDVAVPESLSGLNQWSVEEALKVLTDPLPDAIFAFSDTMAMKIMEAAEIRGIRIPEDISLVGYDNIALSALPRIHLTTVSQKKFRQGAIAAERLIEKIQGKQEETTDILEPELIIRSTCTENKKGGTRYDGTTQ